MRRFQTVRPTLLAAALVLSAIASPAAANTDQEAFDKTVGKLAVPFPAVPSEDAIRKAISKGKAHCVCPLSEFVGRAGVVVSTPEPEESPLIICLVPLFSDDGDLLSSYISCGDWQPLIK
jgi:hypothetical protein